MTDTLPSPVLPAPEGGIHPSQAFDIETAFRTEAPGLLGYFMRRVSPREDAADLVSETFLVAWRRASTQSVSADGIRAWLYAIARNVLSQHRRGTGRRTALGERLRGTIGSDAAAQINGEASGIEPELADHVRQLISYLPPLDQEIITLVYWEGFTQEEVAVIVGKRSVTVRSRLSRARALLRSQLLETDDTK